MRRPGPLRFKFLPHSHQRREFFAYRAERARARFWTMRTGKSKITIDEAAWLYHMGFITGVVVVAPNTVHQNWILKEFPAHCAVPWDGMYYVSAKAKQKGVKARFQQLCQGRDNLKVFSINSTAMRTDTAKQYLVTFVKQHQGRVLVIYDEAHDFKVPGSKRTQTARGLTKLTLEHGYRRVLTGTPIHGSPMNAYSIFELLEPGALGFTNYEKFKQEYGLWEVTKTRAGRPYVKFLGPRNEEELMERMAKYTTVIRREDVPDLQKPINVERVFELTDKQRKVYDTLFENPVLDGKVLDGGVFFQKLQQIASGFLNTEAGLVEIVEPDENPRFDLILNEIKNNQGKSIVWCQYHYEFEALRKLLKEEDIGFCEVHGLAPTKNHIQTVYEFGRSNYQTVCVGHPKSGGQGLDFSFVNLIVWGSHTFDLIDRDQGSERGTAIGKKPVDLVDLIAKNTVDEYIINAQNRKLNTADLIAGTGLLELKRQLSELRS